MPFLFVCLIHVFIIYISGPNQSGSRCHMTCKMAGKGPIPGCQWGPDADIGLAHFYVMQNMDNLYFPRSLNKKHILCL